MNETDERHLRRAIELAAEARASGDMPYDGPALFAEARVPIDGYYA